MRKNKEKIVLILFIILSVLSIGTSSYGHSGRTDSSGGHKDNKNKSGLGSYHYHCGGHPAHLHNGGVCPYSSSSSSSKSSTSSSSSSSSKSTTSTSSSSGKNSTPSSSSPNKSITTTTTPATPTATPSTIEVTDIQINKNIESLEVGKSTILTTTITPNNATDQNITWKSGNENIATVSATGEITAKHAGTVEISATSSNGKTNSVTITIKEEPKAESTVIKTSLTSKNNTTDDNTTTNNEEDSNPLAGFLTLGLLGGGGYWGYSRYKKHNQAKEN